MKIEIEVPDSWNKLPISALQALCDCVAKYAETAGPPEVVWRLVFFTDGSVKLVAT